ncbi:MAG: hypothetical protein SFZ23_03945 [Planctomycetota bacterium]|nr:hypothetical protein [Planctomycetota bacterium]
MPRQDLSRRLRVFAGLAAGALAVSAQADVINWVGYQYGPPGGSGSTRDSASWFHGDQWFNYLVPGPSDVAIFDEAFDPQNNGMPHNVYFGDFFVSADPPFIPQGFWVEGGDAAVNGFEVREGDFEFKFVKSNGQADGSLVASGYFVIGRAVQNWTRDVEASLTIRQGVLSQSTPDNWAGVAIGEGYRSVGTLTADGPEARINIARDIAVGNGGGTGHLIARNGGRIEARSVVAPYFYSGPNGELSTAHILVEGSGSFCTANGVAHGSMTILSGGILNPDFRMALGASAGSGSATTKWELPEFLVSTPRGPGLIA